MDSITQNIQEYEESARKINSRIQELHRLIQETGGEAADLNERRYALYKMLWELEEGIREMKEYIKSSDGSGPVLASGTIPRPRTSGGGNISVGMEQVCCGG